MSPVLQPPRSRRRVAAVAASAGLAAVLVAGCSQGPTDPPLTTVPPAARGAAVTLSGQTLDGSRLDVADLRGSVVVLNVWGSWCGPCRGEASVLAASAQALVDQKVQFVGINIKDNADAARAFERKYSLSYPSIFDTGGTTLLALRALPAVATPTTVLLDAQGRPAARFLGPVTEAGLQGAVRTLLAEGTP